MKAMRIIAIVIFVLTVIIWLIPNGYGKKYKVNDKDNVYYKGDGVTENDAKKVGEFLTSYGYFGTETESSVQIKAEENSKDIEIRFVVKKDKVTPEISNLFLSMGNDMVLIKRCI